MADRAIALVKMIVDQLIRELQTYPEDWLVLMEVNSFRKPALDVDIQTHDSKLWVIITDEVHTQKVATDDELDNSTS